MSYSEQRLAVPAQKRKRAIQEAAALEDIAWTAARCNRLLRTITSRIENLRRLVRPAGGKPSVPSRPRNTTKREHWSSADPVWLPNGTKKPQVRTYSNKPRKCPREKHAQKTRKRGLLLPSPFIRRLQQRDLPGVESVLDSPSHARETLQTKRRQRQLPIKPGTLEEQNEKGLVSALTTVLRNTRPNPPLSRRGASSLLSTCLRKVPAFINLEEDVSSEGDQCDNDTSAEILSYLEELGTVEGGGWYGLREVVRSQSIHCITQAIADDSLSNTCISQLADICMIENALAEAEVILQAWYSQPDHLLPPQRLDQLCFPRNSGLIRMRVLRSFALDGQRLAEVSRDPDFWNELLAGLARPGNHEAINTLHHCIDAQRQNERRSTLLGAQAKSLSTGLKELGSKLCTMAVSASMLAHAPVDSKHLQQTMYRAAIQVAFATGPETLAVHPFVQASMLINSLSANDDEYCGGVNPRSVFQMSCTSSPRKLSRADDTSREDFANLMAKDLVALDGHAELGLVGAIIERIAAVLNGSSLTTSAAAVLRQVALQVVTCHNQTSQTPDGAFTYELEQILSSRSSKAGPSQTPDRVGQGSKLRWEEGLCEWVMRTPFTAAAVEELYVDTTEHIDEKENEPSVLALQSPPSANVCSPDVLTLSSPPAKRLKRGEAIPSKGQTRHPLVDIGYAPPQVIIPIQEVKRHQSRRRVMKFHHEESDDELGF